MPLVKIEIIKGKSKEYKRGILDGIHTALVDVFKIPNDDRIQRIYELEKENFEYSSNKTENITIIEMIIFKGRGKIVKEKLYKEIVKNLKRNCNIDSNDITIILKEPEMYNWAINGISAEKYDFKFNLQIE